MDFIDIIKQLSEKITKTQHTIKTEEATKHAFILPFIQSLGYNVFDPSEVVPEYISDIGLKKGEKVDYAITQNNNPEQPIILIECKHHEQNLDLHNSQLLRYFHTSKAKFGVLTNGINYRFYTDLNEANKMDENPFFEFNIVDIKDQEIEELKKFHKSYFDASERFSAARELKYSGEIKKTLKKELEKPSEDFVRLFVSKIYPGRASTKIIEQFSILVEKVAKQFTEELVNNRLKQALAKDKEDDAELKKTTEPQISQEKEDSKIITTEEELEGFYIIKAILRQKIESSRIIYRDTQSYFGILLDDNNRKPICRLYFNNSKKYLALFDENKKETKIELVKIDDIYNYSEQLKNTIDSYCKESNE